MARSLKTSQNSIETLKLALRRSGYARQQDIGEELGLSLATVKRFFSGKSIERSIFLEICQKMELNWQELVDVENQDDKNFSRLSHVLHLSDLHFGSTDNARTWYAQLAEDLRYELQCSRLDALIICGDIASKSTPDEYAAAQLFINRLSQEFQLESQQIVIVPGNHDVNLQLAEASHFRITTGYSQEGTEEYLTDENGEFIEGLDGEQYKQRFINFSRFYEAIKGELYPLEYDQQYSLQYLPEQNLLILGLNSAWQIDHRDKYRASINSEALSNALSLIRRNPAYKDCLKIAVLHHPIKSIYVDKIADNSVIESLTAAGFRLVLHGSVPSAENSFFHYDYSSGGKQIDVIGAGIFGIYQIQNDFGYPCQYNLLKIEENQVTVETRKRDEPNSAWKPDIRWNLTSELNPFPHYVITLTQNNLDDPEVYFERSNAYIQSGRYEEAITSLDQAIKIKPDFYEAWLYRGVALVKLEKFEEAITSLDQAIKIKPVDQAWNSRGLALLKLGRFEEAIASYDKAIEIKPDFYEAWLYRGEALANLGRIEEAIHDYEQELVITQEIGNRSEQAFCLNNLGNAYRSLGQYQQAIDFYQQSLEISREIGDRYREMISLSNLGGVYCEETQGSRAENIESAIAVYTSVLEICDRESFPEQWAEIQYSLGQAYSERIKSNKADNLELSITAYNKALSVFTRTAFPEQWAMTQYKLGTVYAYRIQGDKVNNIEKSIATYKAALKIIIPKTFPYEWAKTQNSLGDAYCNRIVGNKANNIKKAITAYKKALAIFTVDNFNYEWARIQSNLGRAYFNKIQGDKAENLELAIAYYQQALKVFTFDAFPVDWAATQNNLGEAYRNRVLGERTENLELAITCYQEALKIYTFEAFPYEWARMQANLANAYSNRNRGDQGDNLEQAITACQQALQVYTREAFPQEWATTQNNLAAAYSERIQGEHADNLEQAIAAYQKALQVYTSSTFSQNWARTQMNLGTAYSERILKERAENLEFANACYQNALKVYTREAFPSEWAATQNNLGLAFSERIKGDKAENLQTAIAYYNAALEVYAREAFPCEWANTCKSLGNAYTEKTQGDRLNNVDSLNNIEYAILLYQNALEIYTPERFPDESAIIREKLSNAHYLLEYYQRELELASSSQLNTCDEALSCIELVRANILDLEVDAIVIPTSPFLDLSGQVGKQLLASLGSRLSEQLQNQERPSLGEVVVIDGSTLPASYLFFTPVRDRNNITEINIFQGVTAALTKANSLSNVRTIAFPAVGTGAIGFNPAILAPKILKIVTNHLNKENHLEKVIFAFIDETAYQAYASAYQKLLLETGVAYNVSVTIPQETVSLGEEIEISVNLNQAEITQRETYTIEISRNDANGSELNIILTAPGFQFNGDNTTSLPLDPDTANITQTATFNLTALRLGKTKIKAELYCRETYKTTLETEVEVTAFEETEIRPLIAARSRPVSQPDIILQVRTTWNADISACTFNYHIDSYQPRLLFADDVDYNSQSLSATWVERSHSLLKTTLEEAATSLREDFRSRLVSLGQYLFQSLFPEELQNTFRTIASFNQPFSLLILADQNAWFPWELLHDGQKFLGDRFIIGRWLWELEKSRPYEFPVGAVNVAHYASVEQAELWTELLHSSGAPPPIPMQAGTFNDITLFESIRGLHLIRYGQSVDTTNRQDAPVRVNSSSDIQDIEREVQPAKLSLRRNHPLVSLSYLNAGEPELTALEQTWASTFVRAGCSAFVGSLWAVQPNVEAAFVSTFYNSIWAGQTLGVAFQTARRLAKSVVPESLDWLAYVLFSDPMARPYRPVQGQGYAVVEPIGQEIDDPVSPGSTVRFRVSLRRTPPVWYENRLMEVAEDLSFDDLRVFIVTSGLQVTPGDSILMTRTATGDYLGWFTLTVPAEMESRSVLVQVYFEDGIEPVHNLRFALNIVKQDGEAQ